MLSKHSFLSIALLGVLCVASLMAAVPSLASGDDASAQRPSRRQGGCPDSEDMLADYYLVSGFWATEAKDFIFALYPEGDYTFELVDDSEPGGSGYWSYRSGSCVLNLTGDLVMGGDIGNVENGFTWRVREQQWTWQVYRPEGKTGGLKVTINPEEVQRLGAMWKLDDGEWNKSGVELTDVEVGRHAVTFKKVSGTSVGCNGFSWVTPAGITVLVVPDDVTEASVTYESRNVDSLLSRLGCGRGGDILVLLATLSLLASSGRRRQRES